MDFVTKKGKQIIIRQPKVKDLKRIHTFYSNLVEEDIYILRHGNKVTLKEERKWLTDMLKSMQKGQKVLLQAWHQNKPAGQIEITKGQYRRRFVGGLGIAIDKDFRGEGIGEHLMKEIEKAARKMGVKILELSVYEENQPARNLYKKMGFVEFGRLPKAIEFRGKMLDEVYMYKRLD